MGKLNEFASRVHELLSIASREPHWEASEAARYMSEERLLEFLQAYLRIDRGTDEFEEDAAYDPVCGMRMSRSQAVANRNYGGHPYFFCSLQCAERFDANPNRFLRTTTESDLES